MSSPDPYLAELERLLKRDERGRPVGSTFATQKLAPQVLAPPPEPGDLAADDLDPVEIEPAATARWIWITGLAVAIGAVVTIGWMFRPSERDPAPTAALVPPAPAPLQAPALPEAVPAPPPAIPANAAPMPAPPPATVAVAPPLLPTASIPPVAPEARPMPEARPAASGRVDLVRPDTQGLSPARLVRSQVILVRDDREVTAGR